MRKLKLLSTFSRDLKRLQRSADRRTLLAVDATITMLAADEPLPERFADHPLKGDWKPARECHVKSDLLLVYEKTPGELHLRRLASHSELFG